MAISASASFPPSAETAIANYVASINPSVLPLPTLFTLNLFGVVAFDVSNEGITFIDPSYMVAQQTPYATANSSVQIYANGNALSSQNVSDLLQAMFESLHGINDGIGSASVDLSGGTNGAPIPAKTHIDESDTIHFLSPTDGDVFEFYGEGDGAWGFNTTFDASINLADSSQDIAGSFSCTIGIQDNPSTPDIAAMWASLITSAAIVNSVSVSADVVTITETADSFLPFGGSSCSSATLSQVQAGQNYEANAALTTLIGDGWTITTN